MTKVKILGAYSNPDDLEKEINELLSILNVAEIQYKMALNDTEVLYSALVVIIL